MCDDDIGLLRWRLGLPVPDGPPYTTADYDVREGVAESVMKELLLDNLKDNRSMDSFQISVDKGRGNTIQLKARFDLLLSLLQEAGSKGNLKFDVVDGLFDVSIPQNLQNEVVFSFGNGNLLDYQLKQKACLGNYGYLLGEGELKDRFVYEGGNSSSQQLWGRREFVRDERRLKASDDFSQALDSSLKEYDEVFELQATCIDSSVAKYGEDYFVGSKVKVFVPKLFAIEEQVSEVRFRFDAENGDVVQPTIGNVDPLVLNGGMTFFSQQRALAKRIGNLEKV